MKRITGFGETEDKNMFVGAQDTPAEGLKKQTNLHQ